MTFLQKLYPLGVYHAAKSKSSREQKSSLNRRVKSPCKPMTRFQASAVADSLIVRLVPSIKQ